MKKEILKVARDLLHKEIRCERHRLEEKLGKIKAEQAELFCEVVNGGISFSVFASYRPAGCRDATQCKFFGINLEKLFKKAIKSIARDVRLYKNSVNKNGVFFKVQAKFNGREIEIDRRYWRDILKELNWKKTVFGN